MNTTISPQFSGLSLMKTIKADGSSRYGMIAVHDGQDPRLGKDEVELITYRDGARSVEKLGNFSAIGELVEQFEAKPPRFTLTDSMRKVIADTLDALQGNGLSREDATGIKTRQLDRAKEVASVVVLTKKPEIYTSWVM